jgi:protein DGCR14
MADPNKSTALIEKRKLDVAMMPPPPSKKIKRPAVVLDEDAYLNGLSHVIARDYFPGLLQTEAKQELLDALDSKNEAWIRDAGSRLHQVMEGEGMTPRRGVSMPTQTPKSFVGDTPLVGTDTEAKPVPDVDLNLSLTAFQAKYTSEDNESFNALIDKQNSKNREKQTYLWNGNQIPTARQITYREQQAKLLAQGPSNALELLRRDDRPAMPNHRPSAPRNSLMFLPDSIEDTHTTVAQESEAQSNAPPKAIDHANTRVERNVQVPKVPASPTLSALNDAIAGRPRLSESEAGWETPRVAGYTFVDAEPTASEMQAYETMQRVDTAAIISSLTAGAKGGPGPFNIKESGKREQLHHRLLDRTKNMKKSGNRLLDSKDGGLSRPTPTPSGTPVNTRAGSLTPAARLLFDRVRHGGDKARTTQAADAESTPIFDPTPVPKKTKRSNLLPGLTPKPSQSKPGD